MKRILLIALLPLLAACASFVPVEVENGKALGIMPMQYGRISYQGTHTIPASREDIFRQVRRWAAFRSTRTVYTGPYLSSLKIPNPSQALYVGDNLLGDVITTGLIEPLPRNPKSPQSSGFWPSTYYTISVECYEGSYRATLTNFYTLGLPSPHLLDVRSSDTSLKQAKEFYHRIDGHVMELLGELEDFVKQKVRTASK